MKSDIAIWHIRTIVADLEKNVTQRIRSTQ